MVKFRAGIEVDTEDIAGIIGEIIKFLRKRKRKKMTLRTFKTKLEYGFEKEFGFVPDEGELDNIIKEYNSQGDFRVIKDVNGIFWVVFDDISKLWE